MVYYQARFSDRPCGMALISGRDRRELGPMSTSTVRCSSPQSSRRYRSYSTRLSHGTSRATRSVRTQLPRLLALDLRVLLSAGYEFLMQHCSHFSGLQLAGHAAAHLFHFYFRPIRRQNLHLRVLERCIYGPGSRWNDRKGGHPPRLFRRCSLTVHFRSDSSPQTIGYRFRSLTRCIPKTTREAGNKVQHSRKHSPSTLTSSFSAFGTFPCLGVKL